MQSSSYATTEGQSLEITTSSSNAQKKQTKKTTAKKNTLFTSTSTSTASATATTTSTTTIANKTEPSDLSTQDENNIQIQIQIQPNETPTEECVKKRGRKPQGGKIIKKTKNAENQEEIKSNVILHLKCFIKDLDMDVLNESCNIQPYTDESVENNYKSVKEQDFSFSGKNIQTKIKELEYNLHTNNVNDKKSACFHCTCPFDNTPFYIPKCYVNNSYDAYGCFCSPECAVSFLFNESIENTVKFERYAMLNHIYGKSNGYTQNIKPAPSPYYTLDKYYGNLTINEYRSLFKKDKYLFIVDKPLTRVMPELYEDNDTHIIHNKFMNTNNKLKSKFQSKSSILNETFSVSN